MASVVSVEVRKSIVKDSVDQDLPLDVKRRQWEEEASRLALAEDVVLKRNTVGGVPCLLATRKSNVHDRLVVYVHGGGMVEGSPVTHQEFASRLVCTCQVDVLLVEYRLAPEHRFPAARSDISDVLLNIENLGYAEKNISVGGDSSGAGLLVATLCILRNSKFVMPDRMFLISGVFDQTFTDACLSKRNSIDPMVSVEVLRHYVELYAPGMDKADPGISPIFDNLCGLPAALVLVGSDEILLGDSKRFVEKMTTQGNSCALHVWPDMWHVWPMFPTLPEARQALEVIREFLST